MGCSQNPRFINDWTPTGSSNKVVLVVQMCLPHFHIERSFFSCIFAPYNCPFFVPHFTGTTFFVSCSSHIYYEEIYKSKPKEHSCNNRVKYEVRLYACLCDMTPRSNNLNFVKNCFPSLIQSKMVIIYFESYNIKKIKFHEDNRMKICPADFEATVSLSASTSITINSKNGWKLALLWALKLLLTIFYCVV